jgi:hypothetical protein
MPRRLTLLFVDDISGHWRVRQTPEAMTSPWYLSRDQGPFERSGRGRRGGKEAKTAMFLAAALCDYPGPAGSGEHGGYRFRTVTCSKVPRRLDGTSTRKRKEGRV